MSFRLGYNTSGFPHHRLEDAIDILAEIGFQSVGITLDQHHLNPFEPNLATRVEQIWARLNRHEMDCVVETGARFLLDPRRKHQPTLMDEDDAAVQTRLEFLKLAMNVTRDLGADVVSIWSGAKPESLPEPEAQARLIAAVHSVCDLAHSRGVKIAFEPEPGMFIENMNQYRALRDWIANPRLGLTLDVGHVHCLSDGTPEERVRQFQRDLWNIHIEDMRVGVHEHLMFDEGEMVFPPIFAALREISYSGGVYVELSRHGHDAVNAAKKSYDFLSKL